MKKILLLPLLFFASFYQLEAFTPFPAAKLTESNGYSFSFWADFLYLEASSNHLSFVESGNTKKNSTLLLSSFGETYYPSFSFNPGFKLGLSLDLNHDNWNMEAEYAWLNGNGNKVSVSSTYINSSLVETRPIFLPYIDRVIQADGDFDFLYQTASINLGKNFFLSNYLTSRPYMGLKSLFDTTQTHVHYKSHTNEFLDGHFISQIYKQDFFGIGFQTGLDLSWLISENFSILTNFSMLNLWSKFDLKILEKTYELAVDLTDYTDEKIYFNTSASFWGLQNATDLYLGLKWHLLFDENRKSVSIQMGWDQQVFINHLQKPIATKLSHLNIQGLDLQLRLNF